MKTVGGGAELVMSASNLLSGVTIAGSSFVEIQVAVRKSCW